MKPKGKRLPASYYASHDVTHLAKDLLGKTAFEVFGGSANQEIIQHDKKVILSNSMNFSPNE